MQVRDPNLQAAQSSIPIVAIGASAGGLEPLETFFEKAPQNAGWAYIVIQHLSPDYRSVMDQLLARRSSLTIRHIDDGTLLEKDTLYLNRPNTMVRLDGDVFRTQAYAEGDAVPHLPIDTFFASLSERPPEQTVAIVLSGSGSDGTRGAGTLSDIGATVLAQLPDEAGFSSMPRSVLTAGYVDRVLPVAEIPEAIRNVFTRGKSSLIAPGEDPKSAPQTILSLLEEAHQLDFSDYKSENVWRRIERRQHLRGYASANEYRDALAQDPAALEELYHDLLIGVTRFYRDPDSITALRENAIDKLINEPSENMPLRIWVPGCASGEEAYTIAIELSEAMRRANSFRKFRVIATDVHRRSIDFASVGTYPKSAMENMPDYLRDRYFDQQGDQYVVDPALRQKIIFSVHDVLGDPPFMHLDLISCRNLLIYLKETSQARVISMFLFGLRKDGYLLLGPSESIGKFGNEFQPINARWRLFQKVTSRKIVDRSVLSTRFGHHHRAASASRDMLTPSVEDAPKTVPDIRNRTALIRSYDTLLKRYAPSSILLTETGFVLSWFGTAELFIDTMNNMADWTVRDIVHPDLHYVVSVAIEKLRDGNLGDFDRVVDVDLGDETPRRVQIGATPLTPLQGTRLLLVLLKDLDAEDEGQEENQPKQRVDTADEKYPAQDNELLARRIQDLERDLRTSEETLRHVTARLEASGEQLQATNEELQASNEELQASNEELQSSNEELHAVNEELVTLSAEHETKIEMLSELNRNTEMVLDMMRMAAIFLDAEGRIRRFSALAAERFGLLLQDVDRSFQVVGPRLDFVDPLEMANTVLESGQQRIERGVHKGDSMSVMVRKFDFTTQDASLEGPVAGVVLVFAWDPENSDDPQT